MGECNLYLAIVYNLHYSNSVTFGTNQIKTVNCLPGNVILRTYLLRGGEMRQAPNKI